MISAIKEYIRREDFKKEVKEFMNPVISMIAEESRSYFLYAIILVAAHFVLLGSICFYLVNLKKYAAKIYDK
jgi:hypothetical protein